MKHVLSERVERGRMQNGEYASSRNDDFGFFHVRPDGSTSLLGIMMSAGSPEVPWEHVSVSTRIRLPTWGEMCWVKDQFWDPEEVVIQYHPRRSRYVNHHPYCLHLWRPLFVELPEPPTIAVGPHQGEVSP